MKEYTIIENIPNARVCEQELNKLAKDGWAVVSFGQFQICLEREKVIPNDEEQHLLQG